MRACLGKKVNSRLQCDIHVAHGGIYPAVLRGLTFWTVEHDLNRPSDQEIKQAGMRAADPKTCKYQAASLPDRGR
jgi:hypothetical protein